MIIEKSNIFQAFPSSTAQKIKFAIKDFFSKCDQIRKKLRIWSHLLKKSLMENFIFCAVLLQISIIMPRDFFIYYICANV